MTLTTETIRDQAFMPLECDVPEGMTLEDWRNRRRESVRGSRLRRLFRFRR